MMSRNILLIIALLFAAECKAQYADMLFFQKFLGDSLTAAALSPADDLVAVADQDSIIRLHSLRTGNVEIVLPRPADAVRSMMFSPDGYLLVVRAVRKENTWYEYSYVYNVYERRLLWNAGPVAQTFTADGEFLVYVDRDFTHPTPNIFLHYTDVLTGTRVRSLRLPDIRSTAPVVMSPDGRYAAHNDGREVSIIALSDGTTIRRKSRAAENFTCVAVSPDSRIVAIGEADAGVLLWDVERDSVVGRFKAETGTVAVMDFSPDGATLLVAGTDGKVELWDTGRHLKTGEPATPEGRLVLAGFNGDGSLVATGSMKGIKTWDAATSRFIADIEVQLGPVTDVCFSPLQQLLATAHEGRAVVLWHYPEMKIYKAYSMQHACGGTLAFSPSGSMLAASDGGDVLLLNMLTGGVFRRLGGQSSCIRALDFSSDGKILISGDDSGRVLLRNAETGDSLRAFKRNDTVTAVAMSPDMKFLAIAWKGSGMTVYELSTGRSRWYTGSHFGIVSVRWSPDGATLAIGHADGQIELYDMWATLKRNSDRSPQSVRSYDHCTELWSERRSINISSAFTPDGRYIVLGSCRGEIQICVATTGAVLYTYREYGRMLPHVDISPDGRYIITGSEEKVLILWKARRLHME